MTSASRLPKVAAISPSTNVFCMASLVADSSKNTKLKLCSVKVCEVSGCEGMRENAALTSAR